MRYKFFFAYTNVGVIDYGNEGTGGYKTEVTYWAM